MYTVQIPHPQDLEGGVHGLDDFLRAEIEHVVHATLILILLGRVPTHFGVDVVSLPWHASKGPAQEAFTLSVPRGCVDQINACFKSTKDNLDSFVFVLDRCKDAAQRGSTQRQGRHLHVCATQRIVRHSPKSVQVLVETLDISTG
ncbi:hypothetical protein Naga_100271g5 [Nannochloropsis gaditana]|uniref:Uncharacterized protein n=1 Tax=Nannochloropsis gaditana TaxID=72520 RepID=W7TKV5_9STRA|nr:hypothetical protein Naga_100271g5 [Nannochloropsis gaditana]